MKVLVADDDPVVRRLLEIYLQEWGHEVVLASDGERAWALFQECAFSIVISDWMMPDVDGLELVRRIRASEWQGYVYVILLTSKSRREDIVRGMEAGADDFMAKPFDRDELRVRLRAGVRILNLEQSLAQRNVELQASNAGLFSANQRMKQALDAAARIQRALLPTAVPELAGARFAWVFRPCEELAGDILNVIPLGQGILGLYLLDVSGHGVASALLSVTISRLLSPVREPTSLILRCIAGTQEYRVVPPVEVAEQLNRRFFFDPEAEQFFTIIYGILDLDGREFRFVSAGHPGLVYLPRGAAPSIVSDSGLPIGVSEYHYREHCLRVHPGDRLYLYSDGITEAMDPSGRLFGNRGLLESIERGRACSLKDSLAALMGAVEEWRRGSPSADDVSLLAVEIAGSQDADDFPP
jgi:sigma-B regulation protein RsbU (phosphoserine phosphatase)